MTLAGCIGAVQTQAVDPVGAGGLTPRQVVNQQEIKDDEDRRLATGMPAYFQSELVRRIRESGRLECAFTRLAPGSRALRYLVGFGAGRSKAQTEVRFIDARSGQVVMVTADRRVAAVGFFGGDSEDHLKESFDDMARDMAKFLTRLAAGERPKPQRATAAARGA